MSQEHAQPSHSSLFDPEDPFELSRLMSLDPLMSRLLGHPLAGLSPDHLARLGKVLDLACGPGGWVLDLAFAHPRMQVAGVDISTSMIAYANARARTQHLRNATFQVMDLRQPLAFPDGSFDLINGRFLGSVLLREQWTPLLAECMRVLKAGGVMRLTDTESFLLANSTALSQLNGWLMATMHRRGYGFGQEGAEGTYIITPRLSSLLDEAGFQEITLHPYALDCSASSPQGVECYYLAEQTYGRAKPLVIAQELTTEEDYLRAWQQASHDMRQPSFYGLLYGLTVWGYKYAPRPCTDQEHAPAVKSAETD